MALSLVEHWAEPENSTSDGEKKTVLNDIITAINSLSTDYAKLSDNEVVTGDWTFEGLMTIGDGAVTDPIELVKFDTESDWSIRKRGTGASTRLALEADEDAKEFWIGYDDGTVYNVKFGVDSVQADNYASFGGQVNFAAGTTYKVESDGDAYFKIVNASGNVLPTANGTLDLGAHPSYNWKDLYLAGDISDGTVAISVSEILDLEMVGSGKGAFVPVSFENRSTNPFNHTVSHYSNTNTGTIYFVGALTLPTLKGSHKLYVGDVRISVINADSNNYIDEVWIRGTSGTTVSTIASSVTDINTTGDKIATISAVDASGYTSIFLVLKCEQLAGNTLTFGTGPQIKCYYSTA